MDFQKKDLDLKGQILDIFQQYKEKLKKS